jgi:hypothetical protein
LAATTSGTGTQGKLPGRKTVRQAFENMDYDHLSRFILSIVKEKFIPFKGEQFLLDDDYIQGFVEKFHKKLRDKAVKGAFQEIVQRTWNSIQTEKAVQSKATALLTKMEKATVAKATKTAQVNVAHSSRMRKSREKPKAIPKKASYHYESIETGACCLTFEQSLHLAQRLSLEYLKKDSSEYRALLSLVCARLRKLGLEADDVEHDGNCFYRAIAKMLAEFDYDEERHSDVRHLTVSFMRLHHEVFEQFLLPNDTILEEQSKTQKFDSFCDTHSKDGDWVSNNLEIMACATALNLVINIVGKTVDDDTICTEEELFQNSSVLRDSQNIKRPKIHIYIAHLKDRHFLAVKALSVCSGIQPSSESRTPKIGSETKRPLSNNSNDSTIFKKKSARKTSKISKLKGHEKKKLPKPDDVIEFSSDDEQEPGDEYEGEWLFKWPFGVKNKDLYAITKKLEGTIDGRVGNGNEGSTKPDDGGILDMDIEKRVDPANLIMPQDSPAVFMKKADKERLKGKTWLNDELVNFWAGWIGKEEPVNTSNCFIWQSFFYAELRDKGIPTALRWTAKRNVDLFSKRFIMCPVNEGGHWSLAIIVNPGAVVQDGAIAATLLENMTQALSSNDAMSRRKNTVVMDEGMSESDDEGEVNKANLSLPGMCIIHLDSAEGDYHNSMNIAKTLRNWLISELVQNITGQTKLTRSQRKATLSNADEIKKTTAMENCNLVFNDKLMPLFTPKVPQQMIIESDSDDLENTWDCGAFMCLNELAFKKLQMNSVSIQDITTTNFFNRAITNSSLFKFSQESITPFRQYFYDLVGEVTTSFAKFKKSIRKKRKKDAADKVREEEDMKRRRKEGLSLKKQKKR